MNFKIFFVLLLGGIWLASCGNSDKKAATAPIPANTKPALMQPFRFHKLTEVSPGNYFDVFSWGRGSSETGAFMILHSDSAGIQYTTTTGDLDGAINDVYNTDMDVDGNPEILIEAKTKDTVNFTQIYAFEFNGTKAQKLDFPKLTKSQRNGYRGGDDFYITDGKLMRSFPIYDGNDKTAKPTAAKRVIEYGLRNNDFTVKQISKDSTATQNQSTANQTVKQEPQSASSSKSEKKSSKKKHTTKKKKHRHRG